MNYNLSRFDSISRLIISMLTYIVFFTTVLMIYQEGIPAPHYLFGIPVILICYHFVQRYCNQLFISILLHLSLLIPVFLILFPYKEYQYLYFIMIGFEIIQFLLLRRRNADKPYQNIPWYLFIGVCLIYMIASRYHQTGFTNLIYILGLGLILLHYVRFFLAGLIKILSGSSQTTSIPAKKIIINNTALFLMFLLIFTLCAISIQYTGLDESLSAFGKALLKVIGFILRIIFYIVAIVKALFSTERHLEETQEAEENVTQALAELGEPTLIARIIEGILTIGCICLVVYFIYIIIHRLIRLLTKHYTQDNDIILQINKPAESTTTTENKISVIEQIKEFLKNDNVSKIRRGYRLKIKSYKSLEHKDCDTPAELAGRIDANYHENINELTKVYEKARYSNEEITFDDVQKGGIL